MEEKSVGLKEMSRRFELTDREKEVFELDQLGYTPKQIAAILEITTQRVYALRQNAKYRLMNQIEDYSPPKVVNWAGNTPMYQYPNRG